MRMRVIGESFEGQLGTVSVTAIFQRSPNSSILERALRGPSCSTERSLLSAPNKCQPDRAYLHTFFATLFGRKVFVIDHYRSALFPSGFRRMTSKRYESILCINDTDKKKEVTRKRSSNSVQQYYTDWYSIVVYDM